MREIVENARTHNAKESSKNFPDPHLKANDFQNLIGSSLYTDVSGKIFTKIQSVVFTQTNRESMTNAS